MKHLRPISLIGLLLAGLALALGLGAAESKTALKFEDVFNFVRSNLVETTEAELQQVAIEGFLTQLQPRVLLVTNELLNEAKNKLPLLGHTTVHDDGYAYVCIQRVDSGLADELSSAYTRLNSTNKLKGLILDLRFASGQDYAAAAAAADLFLKSEKPLLDWGAGSARSTTKENALTVPLMILVNRQTRGAAEALVALLRQAEIGLVLGTITAGQAQVFKEFNLDNGLRLQIATASIKLGDGQPISSKGIVPDIEVKVSEAEERAYLDDPYKAPAGTLLAARGSSSTPGGITGTNRTSRRRLNEADLVRLQREGIDPEQEGAELTPSRRSPGPGSDKPLLRDPARARALDLLKGIAVVKQLRQP